MKGDKNSKYRLKYFNPLLNLYLQATSKKTRISPLLLWLVNKVIQERNSYRPIGLKFKKTVLTVSGFVFHWIHTTLSITNLGY